MYRSLPTLLDDAMLARPTCDDLPRSRRPVDELPPAVVEAMNLWMALECLTNGQRMAFKAVVIGLVRQWKGGRWKDVPWEPMTYREAADYLDLDENAVGMLLSRARAKLAAHLSDEEDVA